MEGSDPRGIEEVPAVLMKDPPKRTKIKDTLPDKPSLLILAALSDLESCIEQGYVINMDTWFSYQDGECSVCLAGAMMAQHFPMPTKNGDYAPTELEITGSVYDKLHALNKFRVGYVHMGLEYLKIKNPKGMAEHMKVTPYIKSATQFFLDMRMMAGKLGEAGL